ncbi:MAG: alpha/beta fold hydrolase, partial [bacterium]
MSLNWKRARRRAGIGCLLLLAAFAGLNVLAYRHAYAMLNYSAAGARTHRPEALSVWHRARVLFCGVKIPRPHNQGNPSTVGLPFREVTIPSSGQVQLGAWFCPKSDSGTVALLFHGYGAEKSRMLAEARQFHDLGCAVLLVDFRGSGQSSESSTTVGYAEAEDVAAAVAYARAQCPGARIVLFGQSMGAAAALRAVSRLGVKPDAMILESVFDTMLNTVRHRFEAMGVPSFPCAQLLIFWGGRQMGFDGFAHNPVDYAVDVSCPVLVMHGRNDVRARVADARRVFARLGGPKKFLEFADVGHEPVVRRHKEAWRAAVGSLLAEGGDQKP